MSGFVYAGDSRTLRLSFVDSAGQPAVPVSISYVIRCRTTGTEIRPATNVAPAAVVDVVLTATEDNVIVNAANRAERRRVTVSYTDADGPQVDHYEYTLLNPDTQPS